MSHSTTPLEALATPTRARLVDQLVEILTDAVISGRFPPGSTLPPERELADQLGVNRTSLRQALSRLEQLGLIESQQGRGTIVLDPVANADPNVMAHLVEFAGPELMAELFEVRGGIVTMAARLAADRASSDDVEQLHAAHAAVATATTDAERQVAEMVWFAALVEATHNRALIMLVRWVATAYGGTATSFEPAFDDGDTIARDLRRVVTAIERGQPAAAEKAMAAYATTSGARMLAAFEHRHAADG
jgi:DNA-binding FadR family transcriptional regulator